MLEQNIEIKKNEHRIAIICDNDGLNNLRYWIKRNGLVESFVITDDLN